ncbi:protein MCM10 homolog [Diadema setosum]|uniref:protein MCM10 homolog n=1 Tax=Diadema setosum TaxID=31175 RepID=UPI003B3B3EE7
MAEDGYDDDLDALTALLDDDDADPPCSDDDDVPFTVKPEDAVRVSQKIKERHSTGNRVQTPRAGSGSSQESVDEGKSKEELLEELQRMREELSQFKGSAPTASPSPSQPRKDPPKETFSDALFPDPQQLTSQKKGKQQQRQQKSEKKPSAAAKQDSIELDDNDGLGDLFGESSDVDDSPAETPKKVETVFGKNKKRLAHTPQTSSAPPKKVSPYQCKKCDKVFDKLEAMKIHEFKHKVIKSLGCEECGKTFTDKLQLQTHLRTHQNSAPTRSRDSDKLSTSLEQRQAGASKGGQASIDPAGKGTRDNNNRIQGSKHSVRQIGSGSNPRTSRAEEECETEYFSRIRIINPLVSSAVMKERMKGRKMIRVSILNHYSRTGDIEGDWVTMGVIVRKISKMDSKGKPYSIWVLNDLSNLEECVSLFLFGKIHEEHWKTAEGSVIGILNASVMEKRDDRQFSDNVQLRVDHPQKILMMGKSKDYGKCRGTKKDGQPCSQFVNVGDCQYCVYHVQKEYKKAGSKRTDLSSSYSGITPKSFMKKMKKDNYFYGGQSLSMPSMSTPGGGVTSQSKLTNKFNSNKLSLKSLGVKGAAAVMEEAKNSVLTLHGKGQTEEDMLVKVSGASKEFSTLLKTPTPGTQNLMRHMVSVEQSKKTVSTISANSLLKQHQQEMALRRATRKNSLSQPSTASSTSNNSSSSSSSGLKQTVLTPTTKLNLSSSSATPSQGFGDTTPKLGRGWTGGDDIDLDLSPVKVHRPNRSASSTELAKQRALSLIKKKGRIAKEDPNSVKKKLDERKQVAAKRRAEESWKDDSLQEDAENSEGGAMKKRKMFLGQEVEMSKDEMEKIMSAKSSHSGLLAEYEAELMDRYFKELEKKEGLENRLDSINEVKRRVVSCKQCSFTWFYPSDLCKKEQHALHWHEATQRFFRCKDCNSRTITFYRLPTKPCRSCGGNRYQRATMLKERDGPKIGGETLLIRGEEQKWVS